MLKAIEFGHEEIKKQVNFINEIVKQIGKTKVVPNLFKPEASLEKKVTAFAEKLYIEALSEKDRQKRQEKEDAVEVQVEEQFADIYEDSKREIGDVLYNLKKQLVREKIITKGERPDGRKTDEIRPIWCEAGVLPRVHGSAVFTRGQTQVLTTCTLGMIGDAQMLEGLDDEDSKRYMHHYNMPPYATGESKAIKTTGRREIGHGALAERSLEPVLPTEAEFPYAIRTVSEVLSSNGSTSMASVCGSTMALCQAGVPIKANVAGIAMGLIKEGKKVAVLTDIQGLEDFLGDMDFKVAGTREGITAIQMDIKIKGIDEKILKTALEDARVGRLKILDIMEKTIKKPNPQVGKYAPKIITFNIKPDKIKEVIGSGGKVINKIIEDTGVKIDIEDDGRVFISNPDFENAKKQNKLFLAFALNLKLGKNILARLHELWILVRLLSLMAKKE
ncbi:polyribonucleotide nucleotidyltransferase [Holotrichia oblita]|nr:polyribonucleotide nucleotidyltransferase [Holotrichia oblita]